MRRMLATTLLLCALAACARHAPNTAVRVALVLPPSDSAYAVYSDAASRGLAACVNGGATPTTAVATSPDDVDRQILLMASTDQDEVIGIGYPAAAAVERIANRFVNIHFSVVDAPASDAPNVDSLLFDSDQAGFAAGALAATLTRTHDVAFVGAMDNAIFARYAEGFARGARAVDPHVHVGTLFLNTYDDATIARRDATNLFQRGVDVAYVAAGTAGSAITPVARAMHRLIIAADTDQNASDGQTVAGSVVKNIARAVARACEDAVSQKAATGTIEMQADDGGMLVMLNPALVAGERLARYRAFLNAHDLGAMLETTPAPR